MPTVKKKTTTKKPAKKLSTKKDKYFEAVGRRKSSVARVRLFDNKNKKNSSMVNEKEMKKYFPSAEMRHVIEAPLKLTKKTKDFYMTVKVSGGGVRSQAEAIRLGVSRAILENEPGLRPVLKAEGFLKRDSRVKERRKFGLKKARKAAQWSKR